MSVLRGRPPGLAGGVRGTSKAYCSSLKAWPAPKSPTNARLSAVHMARLREGLFPSSTVGTAASPHARPDERASQTASEGFERPFRSPELDVLQGPLAAVAHLEDAARVRLLRA